MYYTVSQATVLLGVHSQTIRRWDGEGKIRCIRTLGDHVRPSDRGYPDDKGNDDEA